MKFEEILPLMREGKKAKYALMHEGEFWICGFEGVDKDPTLIKMFDSPLQCDCEDFSLPRYWGIERWAIMCDTWEIID
jgi:hypothetical protein